MAYIFCCNAVV